MLGRRIFRVLQRMFKAGRGREARRAAARLLPFSRHEGKCLIQDQMSSQSPLPASRSCLSWIQFWGEDSRRWGQSCPLAPSPCCCVLAWVRVEGKGLPSKQSALQKYPLALSKSWGHSFYPEVTAATKVFPGLTAPSGFCPPSALLVGF